MSSAINTTSPLRQLEAATPVPSNLVWNNNLGAGAQKNFQQTGGSYNTQINGDTINYHERIRTPPPPSSTVPFHRDPHFVYRPQLREFEEKLFAWNKRVALVGLGGVGKSQLAIEFCYRVRDRSPEIWTFWVHASSAARFDADIRKLACDAGIPDCDYPKSDAFALVYSWLRDKRNGKWMLILDNVDDPDFLFQTPDVNNESGNKKCALRNRMAYLPPCAHGSILITLRSRAATARLTDECDVITVSPMGEATAVALLEKKLGQSGATEDIQKLAAALDHMPLALAQAGAYIRQRGSRYSVERYLARLEESEKSQTSLLTSASKERRRDEEAHDSIILTWQISFDYICSTRPSAANLLSLMSMYNYQGIPEYLLRTGTSDIKMGTGLVSDLGDTDGVSDTGSYSSEDVIFEEDIRELWTFHFISTTPSGTSFKMHRLVQLAVRVWLRSHELFGELTRKSIERLDVALPNGNYENWERCRELYPHVTSTLHLDKKHHSLAHASVQHKAAWFDWRRGLWSKAEALVAESYNTRKRILGLEDEETLSALRLHALVLHHQGKFQAAEEMCRRELEGYEKLLGKEHPDTLTGLSNLASVLDSQGKHEEAEEMSRQALEGSEKVLGKEHPSTLTSLSNLASVLSRQGKHGEAEEMSRQALEGSEKVLGKEHSDTLTSLSILASVLSDRGKYEAAEEANRQAVEGRKKVLGEEHPSTLTSLGNLALALYMQRKYDAAEEANRHALKAREKLLGKEHPDTLTSLNNLASVLNSHGKREEAEEMSRQALKGYKKVLGKEHPSTLGSLCVLASVLFKQGKYEEVEEISRQADEGYEEVPINKHPSTLIGLRCLADWMND